MQIVATGAEGLKREFRVVVPAEDFGGRIEARLQALCREVKIPGFRPGKVPPKIVRQRYAGSVREEVARALLEEGYRKALQDHGVKPALEPEVKVLADAEGGPFEFTVSLEVMPEFEIRSFKGLRFERLVVPVDDSTIDETIDRAIKRRTDGDLAEPGQPAGPNDIVVVDYTLSDGNAGGEPVAVCDHDHHDGHGHEPHYHEHGAAGGRRSLDRKDVSIRLGARAFSPEVEDALVGVCAGECRELEVAGLDDQDGTHRIHVHVKEVRVPRPVTADDDFAKEIGAESLEHLRTTIKTHLTREYTELARSRLKRQILDRLALEYSFEVPAGLVEGEFQGIWEKVTTAIEQGRLPKEDAGRTDEELKADYRAIAERRVRLGLLLAAVGRENNIQVSRDEMLRAAVTEARGAGIDPQAAVAYYRDHTDSLDRFRSSIFEEKVIDFIIEMAEIDERAASPEELRRAADEVVEEQAAGDAGDEGNGAAGGTVGESGTGSVGAAAGAAGVTGA